MTEKKWPSDKVEKVHIDKLIPYARNARTHSEEQVAQIAASINEWGWTTPVLVDEDGEIIAGHGRVMAAHEDLEGDLKLGPYTVECKRKKSGYRFLYQSLDQDGADLLCVREDRQRRLWIMEEATLLDLLERAGIKSV